MIVDEAKRKVALFLKNFYNKGNVGAGGNATFPTANGLDVPVLSSNTTASVSISSDTTVDYVISIDGGLLLGNTIRELGIFSENMPVDDTDFTEMINEGVTPDESGSTLATGGTSMLARIVFDPIGPFQSQDVLNFTFTIEVE
tara:strand:- start:63 stop:491 length:429 start_codon:yes stop_codon:yes gene_type:complete